ncbi:hypothetical protein NHP200010_15770 [Helicobacter bizzozeronii]|uniref:vWA domain-containing protein n=1 Tax=Helicobacter bizzozeronii TaxID=56877 RepID=UPI00244D82A1|nr:VWA domain-containing protein [Helicobacter bizzozeronii]GMB93844.1 hypothetical protein NHP200010_15770 [Helicobacter bizzozeronii]
MAFDPSKFTTQEPKAIPLILLLDVSGSMYGEKIDALNQAVQEMIQELRSAEKMELRYKVAIITFGDVAHLHRSLCDVQDLDFTPMQADGSTPMGGALSKAKEIIENKEMIKGRDYRPAVVLVSDGIPTDNWEHPLESFINEGRSAKCQRLGLYIGNEGAGVNVLKRFIEGQENPLFYANNAKEITAAIRLITMSQTQRTVSKNPNEPIKAIEVVQEDPTKRALIGYDGNLKYLLEYHPGK